MTLHCIPVNTVQQHIMQHCALPCKEMQSKAMQRFAVISALALIPGKVRGSVSRSVVRSPIVGRTSALLRHASQTHWNLNRGARWKTRISKKYREEIQEIQKCFDKIAEVVDKIAEVFDKIAEVCDLF